MACQSHCIFTSSVRQMRRIFSNPYVSPRIHELARTIARRRTLSGAELHETLYYLNLE